MHTLWTSSRCSIKPLAFSRSLKIIVTITLYISKKRIHISVKHLRWSILWKKYKIPKTNIFRRSASRTLSDAQNGGFYNFFAKHYILDVWQAFSGAAHGWGGGAQICHTYPAIMKLGTVIPCLRIIQKIYESRDTPLDFCWHQYFFNENQQILEYQKIQKDCVLIHNFLFF